MKQQGLNCVRLQEDPPAGGGEWDEAWAWNAQEAWGDAQPCLAGKSPPAAPEGSASIALVAAVNKAESAAKAKALAAQGLANSHNCKAEWMRMWRKSKTRAGFPALVGAEFEKDSLSIFNSWLLHNEDLKALEVSVSRKLLSEQESTETYETYKEI